MNLLRWYRLCLLVALLTLLSFTSKAQQTKNTSKQIKFIENSWTEALKQASAQKKYIFVDAYATWCGPCKLLKATTFKNKDVISFYNDNFINLSIDVEKGEGPDFARQWGVQAIPTLIIFDSYGKPVTGQAGYIKANDLIKMGVKALNK